MTGRHFTKAELAESLNVSLTTVTNWVRNGCPFVTRGTKGKAWVFDLADVVTWRQERAVEQALGDTSTLSIDEARRRKVSAEAAMMELDLSKRRGEVVEIADVAEMVGEDYANVRAKLLSLPAKLAPVLATESDIAACQGLLEAGISEALDELSTDGIYSAEEGPHEGDTGPEGAESQAAA